MIIKQVRDNKIVNIEFKQSKFPAGELYVKILSELTRDDDLVIIQELHDDDMLLPMTLNAIACIRPQTLPEDLYIVAPYLRYSRQDRVCSPGEAFALRAYWSIVEEYAVSVCTGTMHIVTLDVHNPEVFELEYGSVEFHNIWDYTVPDLVKPSTTIVVPDKGALTRSTRYGSKYDMVIMDKKRENGKVSHVVSHTPDGPVTDLLIIDDICDGGATFVSVAKELREYYPWAPIRLNVAHGIFSGPDGRNLKGFSGVTCTHDFGKRNTEAVACHLMSRADTGYGRKALWAEEAAAAESRLNFP